MLKIKIKCRNIENKIHKNVINVKSIVTSTNTEKNYELKTKDIGRERKPFVYLKFPEKNSDRLLIHSIDHSSFLVH